MTDIIYETASKTILELSTKIAVFSSQRDCAVELLERAESIRESMVSGFDSHKRRLAWEKDYQQFLDDLRKEAADGKE